ncbi:MAG: hypothetical protein HC933_10735 [Pleurocapsa sp. SU_196_0]|nr:hypothetical protein [Pleurocapsa sp. SU_196_0]
MVALSQPTGSSGGSVYLCAILFRLKVLSGIDHSVQKFLWHERVATTRIHAENDVRLLER